MWPVSPRVCQITAEMCWFCCSCAGCTRCGENRPFQPSADGASGVFKSVVGMGRAVACAGGLCWVTLLVVSFVFVNNNNNNEDDIYSAVIVTTWFI